MTTARMLTFLALGATLAFAPAALAQDKPADKKDEKPAEKKVEPEKKPETPAKPAAGRALKEGAIEKRFGLEALNLTAEQKEKLKPFFQEQAAKMQALRGGDKGGDRKTKLHEMQDAVRAKLKDVVTAEQLEKWDKAQGGRVRKKAQ